MDSTREVGDSSRFMEAMMTANGEGRALSAGLFYRDPSSVISVLSDGGDQSGQNNPDLNHQCSGILVGNVGVNVRATPNS